VYGYNLLTFNNGENINNSIKTIVREYKWSPDIIGDLFFDREDYRGLYYWYDDVIEMVEEQKKMMAQNKK